MIDLPEGWVTTPMSIRMRRARKAFEAMSPADRIQTLVEAELMTQEEADAAKLRLATAEEPPPAPSQRSIAE